MKKKIVTAIVLASILATGAAFADSPVHPDGFGIGILGGFGWSGTNVGNVALSLKVPALPVFWGINLGIWNHGFSVGVQGDYYFLGSMFGTSPFGWFLGAGLYVNFATHNQERVWQRNGDWYSRQWTRLGVGARLPVGITFQPWQFFEIFGNVVPSAGVHFFSNRRDWDTDYSGARLGIGVGGEIGLRVWF